LLPVLEALRDEHAGRLNVVYLDNRKHGVLGLRYQVRTIPTLVFCDKAGTEVLRYAGPLPQEGIEARLTKIGIREP
jgi:thioredoxin 1